MWSETTGSAVRKNYFPRGYWRTIGQRLYSSMSIIYHSEVTYQFHIHKQITSICLYSKCNTIFKRLGVFYKCFYQARQTQIIHFLHHVSGLRLKYNHFEANKNKDRCIINNGRNCQLFILYLCLKDATTESFNISLKTLKQEFRENTLQDSFSSAFPSVII